MKKGFTLLEILVAMSLLFIVLAIVYQSFETHVQSMERARALQREDHIARLALNMMARDLQSAYWEEAPSEEGETEGELDHQARPSFVAQSIQGDERPMDRIAFLTLGPSWSPHQARAPWVHEVEYSLAKEQETERIVLIRREDPTPDGDLFSGGEAWILAENIRGFQTQLVDAGGETHSGWDATSAGGLPRAALLRLWIGDPKKPEEEPVLYSLRVAIAPYGQEGS